MKEAKVLCFFFFFLYNGFRFSEGFRGELSTACMAYGPYVNPTDDNIMCTGHKTLMDGCCRLKQR